MKNEARLNGQEWITAGEEQGGEEGGGVKSSQIHKHFTLLTLQLDFNLFPLENNIFQALATEALNQNELQTNSIQQNVFK